MFRVSLSHEIAAGTLRKSIKNNSIKCVKKVGRQTLVESINMAFNNTAMLEVYVFYKSEIKHA